MPFLMKIKCLILLKQTQGNIKVFFSQNENNFILPTPFVSFPWEVTAANNSFSKYILNNGKSVTLILRTLVYQ